MPIVHLSSRIQDGHVHGHCRVRSPLSAAWQDLAPYNIRVNAISPALIGPSRMWDRQNELHAATGSPYFDSDPQVVAERKVASVPTGGDRGRCLSLSGDPDRGRWWWVAVPSSSSGMAWAAATNALKIMSWCDDHFLERQGWFAMALYSSNWFAECKQAWFLF